MKKFIILFIIFAIMFALCACSSEQVPKPVENPFKSEQEISTTENSESETEQEKTDSALYELLTFHKNFGYTKFEYNGATHSCFELDGKIYFANHEKSTVTACSLETGEIVSTEDFSEFGPIMLAEKAADREGCDYRILFGDRAVYRSSKDPAVKAEKIFPNGLKFEFDPWDTFRNPYDVWGDKLVYRDIEKEGIFLKIGEGEAKEIINNSYFEDYMDFYRLTDTKLDTSRSDYYKEEVYFWNPKFICGGSKIVIGVATFEREFIGCGIYDIAEGKVEYWVDSIEPRIPKYPILDRYINDDMGQNIIDAETYEEIPIEIEGFWVKTFDYETFVIFDVEITEDRYYRNFKSEIYSRETGERIKFFDANEGVTLYPGKITENYFLIKVQSTNGEELYAVKYK